MKMNGKAYGICWLVLRKRANYPFTRTRKKKKKAESKLLSKELGSELAWWLTLFSLYLGGTDRRIAASLIPSRAT